MYIPNHDAFAWCTCFSKEHAYRDGKYSRIGYEMPRRKHPIGGALTQVEILHIDTANSRKLYSALGVNAQEKSQCAQLMKIFFQGTCVKHGGVLRQWAGDGGFAFFKSDTKTGRAIEAATELLTRLGNLNAQSAKAVGVDTFERKIRIALHRGEVYLTSDADLDSADPKDFDDFLKFEKKFSPNANHIFITHELRNVLPAARKRKFEDRGLITAGSLRTTLYRLKEPPVPKHVSEALAVGWDFKTVTERDWNYLHAQVVSQQHNKVARNTITLGLLECVRRNHKNRRKVLVSSRELTDLTVRALYNYLRVMYSSQEFRVSYWTATKRGQKTWLKMTGRYHPQDTTKTPPRSVRADRTEFMVCRAFAAGDVIVTPSVREAFRRGSWEYFDGQQKGKKRGLESAIQIPVYRREDSHKVMLGVLSLDTDNPDTFIVSDVNLWKNELVGYLVNLSLAETFRECGR